MHRVRLTISYDGTEYCGWQKQSTDSRPSIQGQLEAALARIFQTEISCVASGRTDAGVHALAQTVHFDAPRNPQGINLTKALKSMLPNTISCKSAMTAPEDFHSLFSARAKTYRYVLYTGNTRPAILGRFAHWYPYRAPLDYLNELSQLLEGTHDFKSFQSVGTDIENTERTIIRAKWVQKSPHLMQFEVTGTGFLKQMVRNIVGTQLHYCKDRNPSSDLNKLILAKDRRKAGPTAPPQGLFLVKVYYPESLDKRCLEL